MIILHNLLLFSFCVKVFTFDVISHHGDRASQALIFGHCKRDYETILIRDGAEQLDRTWFQQLHQQFFNVILYKESSQHQEEMFNTKEVDAILITVSSSSNLDTLDGFHNTTWWNVMIPVYVLHLPDNDCTIAIDILQTIWKNRILTSYFVCAENDGVQIYTYNPFTNRAPDNWIEITGWTNQTWERTCASAETQSNLDVLWTPYRRKYQAERICQGLDFDRTKYLDDYIIFLCIQSAVGPGSEKLMEFSNVSVATRYNFIVDHLMNTSNIKTIIVHVPASDYAELNKSLEMICIDNSDNISIDVILSDFYSHSDKNFKNSIFTRTYPLAWFETGIATQNRGYQTLAEKIWSFYGIWTISFTIFVLFVTFIVVWFFENRRTAFASFETLRLLINHNLHTRMNTLPLRIFFVAVLIYFLVIQATFNGHLARFLTKPELRKHPETREDLRDFGYTLINDPTNHDYSVKYCNQRYGTFRQAENCLEDILHNDTSACIFDHLILRKLFKSKQQREKLYISKKPTESQYSGYLIRKNWPLSNRLNKLFLLLEDLGFRKWLSKDIFKNFFKGYQSVKEEDFQPIKLENLMFGFSILAFGLISAALSFCVEMFINYKLKSNVMFRTKDIKKIASKIVDRMNILCKFRR